jgi:hypothetical protein
MDAANFQYEKMHVLEPKFVIFADDDRWFEPGFRQEMWECIDNDDIDMWYAKSLFFWEPGLIRKDFFIHNSVALFRFEPGLFDRSHNQAPAELHARARDEKRFGQLKARILDYGYCGKEERLRLLKVFKEIGRIDRVIGRLLDPSPVLEKYNAKN